MQDSPNEDIIDPGLPICDAHHHLWDPRDNGIAGSRYMFDDLLRDIGSGHRIDATVFIEADAFYSKLRAPTLQSIGETEVAAGVAAMAESGAYGPARVCAAIVAFADLTLGDAVSHVLEAQEVAAGGRLRGIRYCTAYDPSPDMRKPHTNPPAGLMGEARFREGFSRLAKHGLSFDAFLFHPQLAELDALARAFPDTTIILNHVGTPLGKGPYAGRQAAVFDEWRTAVRRVAQNPNVVVKLGGMGMSLMGFGFESRSAKPASQELADAWRPYYEVCVEAFGAHRAMFESNFPVDRMSCDYRTLWNALKRLSASSSAQERAQMFKDTAYRVYRIDERAIATDEGAGRATSPNSA